MPAVLKGYYLSNGQLIGDYRIAVANICCFYADKEYNSTCVTLGNDSVFHVKMSVGEVEKIVSEFWASK
jgi:hypothetical protein